MPRQKIGLDAVLEMSNFNKGMKQYITGLDRVTGATLKGISGIGSLGSAIQNVGKIAGVAAAAGFAALISSMTLVAKKSVSVAASIEAAFAEVTKTVDGLVTKTEAGFYQLTQAGADLRKGLMDISLRKPFTPEQLSSIAAIGGQLGIARQDLLKFTETIADVGYATNLTAEEAAIGFARLASIMNVPISEVDRMASAVVDLGNKWVATEKEIVSTSMRIAPAARQIGMTAQDVLAISTALSQAGIYAEAGGSAVQTVLIDMQKSIDQGNKSLRTYAAVSGMTAAEFEAAWDIDPGAVFERFTRGMQAVGDETKEVFTVLDSLQQGEIRVTRAILGLASVSQMQAQMMDDSSVAWEKNLALTWEAEKRYATTSSQMFILNNHIRAIGDAIGTVFLPSINEALGALMSMADGVKEMGFAIAFEMNRMIGLSSGWGEAWGANFAQGIYNAIPYVVGAIRAIGRIIAYYFQAQSPPRIAPDIDKWGQALVREYFKGFAKADFGQAINFGRRINDILTSATRTGTIGEGQAKEMMGELTDGFQAMFVELKTTGSVSEDTFKRLNVEAGVLGDRVEAVARSLAGVDSSGLSRAILNYKLALADTQGDLDLWYKELEKVQRGTVEWYEVMTTIVGLEQQLADAATGQAKELYEAMLDWRMEISGIDEQIQIMYGELAKVPKESAEYYRILVKIHSLEEQRAAIQARLADAQDSQKDTSDAEAKALARAILQYRLQVGDAAEDVAIWEEQVAQAEPGTTEWYEAMTNLVQAQDALARSLEAAAKAGAGLPDYAAIANATDDLDSSLTNFKKTLDDLGGAPKIDLPAWDAQANKIADSIFDAFTSSTQKGIIGLLDSIGIYIVQQAPIWGQSIATSIKEAIESAIFGPEFTSPTPIAGVPGAPMQVTRLRPDKSWEQIGFQIMTAIGDSLMLYTGILDKQLSATITYWLGLPDPGSIMGLDWGVVGERIVQGIAGSLITGANNIAILDAGLRDTLSKWLRTENVGEVKTLSWGQIGEKILGLIGAGFKPAIDAVDLKLRDAFSYWLTKDTGQVETLTWSQIGVKILTKISESFEKNIGILDTALRDALTTILSEDQETPMGWGTIAQTILTRIGDSFESNMGIIDTKLRDAISGWLGRPKSLDDLSWSAITVEILTRIGAEFEKNIGIIDVALRDALSVWLTGETELGALDWSGIARNMLSQLGEGIKGAGGILQDAIAGAMFPGGRVVVGTTGIGEELTRKATWEDIGAKILALIVDGVISAVGEFRRFLIDLKAWLAEGGEGHPYLNEIGVLAGKAFMAAFAEVVSGSGPLILDALLEAVGGIWEGFVTQIITGKTPAQVKQEAEVEGIPYLEPNQGNPFEQIYKNPPGAPGTFMFDPARIPALEKPATPSWERGIPGVAESIWEKGVPGTVNEALLGAGVDPQLVRQGLIPWVLDKILPGRLATSMGLGEAPAGATTVPVDQYKPIGLGTALLETLKDVPGNIWDFIMGDRRAGAQRTLGVVDEPAVVTPTATRTEMMDPLEALWAVIMGRQTTPAVAPTAEPQTVGGPAASGGGMMVDPSRWDAAAVAAGTYQATIGEAADAVDAAMGRMEARTQSGVSIIQSQWEAYRAGEGAAQGPAAQAAITATDTAMAGVEARTASGLLSTKTQWDVFRAAEQIAQTTFNATREVTDTTSQANMLAAVTLHAQTLTKFEDTDRKTRKKDFDAGLASVESAYSTSLANILLTTTTKWGEVKTETTTQVDGIVSELNKPERLQSWANTGVAFVKGLQTGLENTDAIGGLIGAAEALAQAVIDAVNDWLDGHSPSRVAMGIGENFTEGFGIGIEKDTRNAVSVARDLAHDASEALQEGFSPGNLDSYTNYLDELMTRSIRAPALTRGEASSVHSYDNSVSVEFGDVSINNGMDLARFDAHVKQVVQKAIKGR